MCQHRTASEPGEAYNPRFSFAVVFAAFTAIGLLRFTTFYLDDITRNVPNTLLMRVVEEGSGAYGALLLFPAIFVLERRLPLTGGRWRHNWPAHIGAFVAYSVLHTTIMWVSRVTILPALGHVPYDYGRMSTRYLMESPNDFFAYGAFLGTISLLRVMHVYDDPTAADAMIGHLGELLRHALRTSNQPEIPLHEELEVLESYLAIIGARFGARFGARVVVELDVDPRAAPLAVPALLLLLQPLVENAVRHGSDVGYASAIQVRIAVVGDELHIAIENEIPASHSGKLVAGTGLATTRDRLRLLYGESHTFSARAVGRRFEIKMSIPAHIVAPLPAESLPAVHARADR